MDQHEPKGNQDPSALPPLFFEPEVDSDHETSQPNSLENTPTDSNLIPTPDKRNEPKLSLSSYQSVASGEITPTRGVTLVDFQDDGVNATAEQKTFACDLKNESHMHSPEIVSKQQKIENDSTVAKQKTSTPIRRDMDAYQQTGHDQEHSSQQTGCDMENSSKERSRTGNRVSFVQTDVIEPSDVRVPVAGFEIMEQRARFTVFKLHVHKGHRDNWFVFRRYTDFVQLQNKLKILFPTFRFALPPKRWFRDNYDRAFLEDRQLGLQGFIDSVLCDRAVCNSKPIQEFFCFNDPPGPLDSLEEGRAYCESLEDRVYTLKKEVKQKDGEIDLLKEELSLYKSQVEMLSRALREKNENGAKKAILSPANSMAECDHLAPEADQSQGKMTVAAEIHQSEKKTQKIASQSQLRKHSPVSQSRPSASAAS